MSFYENPGYETDVPAEELPSSIELEYGILGWIMQDNAIIDHLIFLSPEHFFVPEHQSIFAAMIEMRAEGELITPLTLKNRADLFDGVIKYLVKAISHTAFVPRPVQEARLLIELATMRELIITCRKHVQAMLKSGKSSAEHFADLQADLEKASVTGVGTKFFTDAQVSRQILDDLNNPKKPFSTGIKGLDEAMEGGMFPGMCYLLAGRKKMGKTMLAGTISCNLNAQKIKHLYIAGEMGIKQIQQRNLSRLTHSHSSSFRTDYGKTPQFQNKIQAQIDSSNACIIYLNAPGITFENMRKAIAQAISIHKISGFVVDCLQLVGGKQRGQSEVQHQDEVAQWIADYGKEHNLFSIVTAQMNQTGNIRHGEGIRLACDQGFEVKAFEDDPSISTRYLEMIETRYTEWLNVGTQNTPGLYLHKKGPFFAEKSEDDFANEQSEPILF